jgi:hypothetical protein
VINYDFSHCYCSQYIFVIPNPNLFQDGSIKEFDSTISLLSPFICDAIACKEDRRVRRASPINIPPDDNDTKNSSSSSSSSGPMKVEESKGSSIEEFNAHQNGSIRPSVINLK